MAILAAITPASGTRPRPAGRPHRLLVVSEHRLLAGAVGSLLESPPLCAETRVARPDQLAGYSAREYDAAIVEATPTASATELISDLQTRMPEVPVLAIIEHQASMLAFRLLEAGVAGVLSKAAGREELVSAVRAVADGQLVIDRRLTAGRRGQANSPFPTRSPLSGAELAILGMLGNAWSTKAIAEARGTTLKTVRNQIARLYRKLHLRSRAEAVRMAAELGLVEA